MAQCLVQRSEQGLDLWITQKRRHSLLCGIFIPTIQCIGGTAQACAPIGAQQRHKLLPLWRALQCVHTTVQFILLDMVPSFLLLSYAEAGKRCILL